MRAKLAVRDLCVDYETERGRTRAVENISFEISAEDRLFILGPSGCGKSTILKAIAGLLKPVAGRIELDHQPVVSPGPDRAVVFQEFDQLFPWRTVHGNVTYALKAARGMSASDADRHACEVIEMVGLERASKAYPHQLSGGMKQRVAIARALALQPAMLLLDEPFASLDALTRASLQDELLRIWRDTQRPFIFVTHSIPEAVKLASKILVVTGHPGHGQDTIDNSGFGFSNESKEFHAMCSRLEALVVNGDA